MIHGYKRSKRQKSQQEIEQQQLMVTKINQKLAQFFSIPRYELAQAQLPKYLEFVALLMQLVSDIPTVFNFRRELLQLITASQATEDILQTLSKQIKLTTKLIQSDPKSYTIWSYRQWLVLWLFKYNKDVVAAEKELTRALLLKDEKNFHVWNYRNWLNSVQCSIETQIAFTQQKIKSNPFNFSPYHFRSKFIQQQQNQFLQEAVAQGTSEKKAAQMTEFLIYGMPKSQFQAELERVKTAIFLNPNQEAPWLYYHWLLGQTVPAFVVKRSVEPEGIRMMTNMKVSSFVSLITWQGKLEGQFLLTATKSQSDCWMLQHVGLQAKVLSCLEKYCPVKLESTGRLFLGQSVSKEWMQQHIKSLIRSQIVFIDEVIESEEDSKCRFAYLEKPSLYRWLLQCGCKEGEFEQCVSGALEAIGTILDEPKGSKYINKQWQYWDRLRQGNLNQIEAALKNMFT